MDIPSEKTFKVIVKPNMPHNQIAGYDDARKAFKLNIAAAPQNNKANKEVVKFLSKQLKKRVVISSGISSREKIIRVI